MSKLLEKKWLIIIALIFFYPIGLAMLWLSKAFEKRGKIIGTTLGGLFFIFILVAGPAEASREYDVQTSSVTYEIPGVPETPAVYEPAKSFVTGMSGTYVIGEAPSARVSGNEVKFETAKSGEYTIGEDIPAGIYDVVAISGSGNVIGAGLNEIMAPKGTNDMFDMYIDTYDNAEFTAGEVLTTSGVAVKLVPQDKDNTIIQPGKYNIVAKSGSGNVFGDGLNEIMAPAGYDDTFDIHVDKYDNKQFNTGEKLEVTGVSIELIPHEKEVLVTEAIPATPAKEVVETLEVYGGIEVCTFEKEEVECSTLAKYDELKAGLTVTSTKTETVIEEEGKYTCRIDTKSVDCDKLQEYDALVSEL